MYRPLKLVSDEQIWNKLNKVDLALKILCRRANTPRFRALSFREDIKSLLVQGYSNFGIVNIIYRQGDEVLPELPYYQDECGYCNSTQCNFACQLCYYKRYCNKDHLYKDCKKKHRVICLILRSIMSLVCNECNNNILLHNEYMYVGLDNIEKTHSINTLDLCNDNIWEKLRCKRCYVPSADSNFMKLKFTKEAIEKAYLFFDETISNLINFYKDTPSYVSPIIICFNCKNIIRRRVFCRYCKQYYYCSKSCSNIHFSIHKIQCENSKTLSFCQRCRYTYDANDLDLVRTEFYVKVENKYLHYQNLCHKCYSIIINGN